MIALYSTYKMCLTTAQLDFVIRQQNEENQGFINMHDFNQINGFDNRLLDLILLLRRVNAINKTFYTLFIICITYFVFYCSMELMFYIMDGLLEVY